MVADRIEESYRRLHPRLWHALVAYCGDPELASDAEAEAFAQALRRADEITSVDRWIWRSAFAIAGGLLKARPVLVDTSASESAHAVAPVFQPEVAEFMSTLEGLSSQQRAIVVLRYVGNFRATEIAGVLNTSPGSVRVQLHRAHDQLRRSIGGNDE